MFYTVLYPPPPPPMPGRMGVDLLIDPVSLGWYRSLRVLGHVISFISKIQAKIGTVRKSDLGFFLKQIWKRFSFYRSLESFVKH